MFSLVKNGRCRYKRKTKSKEERQKSKILILQTKIAKLRKIALKVEKENQNLIAKISNLETIFINGKIIDHYKNKWSINRVKYGFEKKLKFLLSRFKLEIKSSQERFKLY